MRKRKGKHINPSQVQQQMWIFRNDTVVHLDCNEPASSSTELSEHFSLLFLKKVDLIFSRQEPVTKTNLNVLKPNISRAFCDVFFSRIPKGKKQRTRRLLEDFRNSSGFFLIISGDHFPKCFHIFPKYLYTSSW